jgi:hypothetical protein
MGRRGRAGQRETGQLKEERSAAAPSPAIHPPTHPIDPQRPAGWEDASSWACACLFVPTGEKGGPKLIPRKFLPGFSEPVAKGRHRAATAYPGPRTWLGNDLEDPTARTIARRNRLTV